MNILLENIKELHEILHTAPNPESEVLDRYGIILSPDDFSFILQRG